ncbi:MAG: peptidase S8/S53 subtilisin kexin sedolisin [Candidatus Saganbacteria bacterium]|uniref:Peptidase S8/S53 subtilisin kexin sedolisin n=1 Tax=Candidatus Saganbacteria bacterium TaxID=2575572 RepID=A0A833L0R5_UNCSA|nr:MAG: peptidase S8/S53 subtilisin kexin sedolisin [Candidatus Saganbacteria bacterium]
MKKLLLLAIALLLASPCFSAYAPDEILVGFKPNVITLAQGISSVQEQNINADSVIKLNKKLNAIKIEKLIKNAVSPKEKIKYLSTGKTIEVPDMSLIYKISLPKNSDVQAVCDEYKKDPNVSYAHPNYIIKAFLTPNDTKYANQWGLAKIDAPTAWDITTGENAVTVAVIDTGADYNHEDLVGKIIQGENYIAKGTPPLDDNGHGTHIAGIIAAVANNSKGVAGVNWGARILAIKVLDSHGGGLTSNAAEGIHEAVTKGAKIINLSWGDDVSSNTLENAVNYAYAQGVLVVAAAGNENTSSMVYPAAYTNVMCVAATDQNDKWSVWGIGSASNYGTWVDISAPGTSIYSTYLSNSYTNLNGTSMATPFVAGVASLLFSRKPTWTPDQLRARIEENCDNIDSLNPGKEGQLGKGRINMPKTIGIPRAQISSPSSGDYVKGEIAISGYADGLDFEKYSIYIGSGSSPSSYRTLYSSTSQVVNGTLFSFNTTATNDGTHTIKLESVSNTPYTVEASVVIHIDNAPPIAEITSPQTLTSAEGTISIKGSASDENIDYYLLEYSQDNLTFVKISSSSSSLTNGDLGSWNTSGLKGKYYIRLTVKDKANSTSRCSIELTLNNSPTTVVESGGITKSSPNPFNPNTQSEAYFSYTLTENSDVAIFLFSINGELIWKNNYLAGQDGGKAQANLVPWNGRSQYGNTVENGVYIYKITAKSGGAVKILTSGKIIVLRN